MTALNRRQFVQLACASLAVAGAPPSFAEQAKGPGRLRKALKYGMIKHEGSVLDKFNLAKACGFEGVEMDSPSNINRDEVVKARDESGLIIHGVVDSIHWGTRLSDPNPEVREKGLAGLVTAMEDCKRYGGTTVLLVPGAVRDKEKENFDQVWERSTEYVKKAIPTADKLGVKIAIEVVWNDFITKPDQLVKYVDQFATPTVGAYFDCSNMLKYGVSSAEWIRALGKRMLKFDFKGYHMEKKWVAIGEGSENWPEVLKALREIGYMEYSGWATSEVGGGGEEHLRKVSKQMDQVLGL